MRRVHRVPTSWSYRTRLAAIIAAPASFELGKEPLHPSSAPAEGLPSSGRTFRCSIRRWVSTSLPVLGVESRSTTLSRAIAAHGYTCRLDCRQPSHSAARPQMDWPTLAVASPSSGGREARRPSRRKNPARRRLAFQSRACYWSVLQIQRRPRRCRHPARSRSAGPGATAPLRSTRQCDVGVSGPRDASRRPARETPGRAVRARPSSRPRAQSLEESPPVGSASVSGAVRRECSACAIDDLPAALPCNHRDIASRMRGAH